MKRLLAMMASAAVLSACSVTKPPAEVPVELPSTWYAPPLPHQGSTEQLTAWWSAFDDPLLADWIARAQTVSPSVASARAQVYAARAARLGVEAQTGPQLNAVANASRGITDTSLPLGTTLSAGLQASWAIGLWGEAGARRSAAQAQQEAAGAGWHEARVLVASELAQLYFGQRLCREQLAVAARDRDSRAITAENNATSERAGLTAPSVAALARASGAEGAARYRQQEALCEGQVKSLTALTHLPEPEVRQRLAGAPDLQALLRTDRMDRMLSVNAVPADAIRQRPDVYRAQRELVAASEEVGVAKAALLPSLSFSGSVLRNRFSGGGMQVSATSWSVGPLTLSMPLLGRGALQANTDSAQARYEAAAAAYAGTVRQAVAEVEQALVTLSGLRERVAATDTAVTGYGQSFQGTEARYRVGLASLNELEEARRLKLNADSSAVALQQERINAWIQLYVALGGGFDPVNNPDAFIKDPS
ncbi:efflux transporter outer membrane subunit [Hydrogenophaga sp. BPS33]|uniref:efflux transporter outer membrane subunit n=1 Tax=Hydrogenophaga sp. BPS33 TaxID=2651974 RepID=UPI00131F54BE|nr:efflux transporter outer membrane subunit [Hydrogenophaga sp. BPS33]QHE86018.1 efflux transporter outer membrane subunit [Hydrogenophaga sp. BPS33]